MIKQVNEDVLLEYHCRMAVGSAIQAPGLVYVPAASLGRGIWVRLWKLSPSNYTAPTCNNDQTTLEGKQGCLSKATPVGKAAMSPQKISYVY